MNVASADLVLRANGLPAGITVDQDKLHFGAVVKDMPSTMKQVTFGNCNATALTNIDATIVGPDMNDFAIAGPASIPSMLLPGQSITFQIQMTPRQVGVLETATLQIAYSGGSSPVALDGTGVTDTGGNKDRQTYYACSTGRPIGLVPLALALAFALRRRRR
jgi:MYXO-CTERM domain-containing protein